MKADQFWQKVIDYYNINHGKYVHAVLTDDEKMNTVTDFIDDMMGLAGKWYNPEDGGTRCGAYAECREELGKPVGWKGCSLPKGHIGNHTDTDKENSK